MKKILTIIISVLIAGGMIGLCVGLGVHFGKKKHQDSPAGKDNFYLLDNAHDWQWSVNNRFAVDENADTPDNVITQYAYTAYIEAGTEVKVWKGSDDWSYNNSEQEWAFAERNENLKFTETGTYTFYLKLYTDGGNSLYIEQADIFDANNLYIDYMRLSPFAPFDETEMTEYDKFRLYIYTAPNYNGSGYYTPVYLDNPLKTGKPTALTSSIGYKPESDSNVQQLYYTLTLSASNNNTGVSIDLQGSHLIHIDSATYSPLGLIFKY